MSRMRWAMWVPGQRTAFKLFRLLTWIACRKNVYAVIPAKAGMTLRLNQGFALKRAQLSSGDTQQLCISHSRLAAILAP